MVFSYSNLVAFCNNRNKVQQKKKNTHTHTHTHTIKNVKIWGKKEKKRMIFAFLFYQNDICIIE